MGQSKAGAIGIVWLLAAGCSAPAMQASDDLSDARDLQRSPDLASGAQLDLSPAAPAVDLSAPVDLDAPDLATDFQGPPPPDLGGPPDLVPPSDLLPSAPACSGAACTALLFDERSVPSFYLTISTQSWNTIASCAQPPGKLMPPECDYQPATFYAVYDPDPSDAFSETVTSAPVTVGLRRKGRATWQELAPPDTGNNEPLGARDGKPSFKLRFDANGGKKFLGLSRLTLNNGVQDPSGVRERLAYRALRAMGVAAPLANSARLFVQGPGDATFQSWGVYVNLQTIDKQFLKYVFGEVGGEVGNLYDTYNDFYYTDLDRCGARSQAGEGPLDQEARFEKETNDSSPDVDDLTALIDALYEPSSSGSCRAADYAADSFVASAEAIADLDALLALAAADALLANWDGFFGARNNYKLYHELARDRFVVIPAGLDQELGWAEGAYYANWHYPIDHSRSGRVTSWFLQRCAASPACWDRYLAQVTTALATWDTLPLASEAATMAAQIRPYVDWSLAEFDRHQLFVQQFLTTRSACVAQQLDGLECATLACPTAQGCQATTAP